MAVTGALIFSSDLHAACPLSLKTKLEHAIVTVETDKGLANGFIADNSGLIITEYPITEGSSNFRVQLNDNTRLEAVHVQSAHDDGLAVLYVNPVNISNKESLLLVDSYSQPDINDIVYAVAAPGLFPEMIKEGKITFKNDKTLATSINYGENLSGAPLITSNGYVAGIIKHVRYNNLNNNIESRVIYASKADTLLKNARIAIEDPAFESPSADPLKPDSVGHYPVHILKNAVNDKYYARNYIYNSGPFKIILYTPPLYVHLAEKDKLSKFEIQKTRKRNNTQKPKKADKEENIVKIPAMNSHSPFKYLENWENNTDQFKAYFMIKVVPKTGHTSGSSARGWASFLLGEAIGCPVYLGSKTLEFKKDFKNLELYINGKLVKPVRIAREVNHNLYSDYFKNLSNQPLTHSGLYLYDPAEVFSGINPESSEIEIKLYRADKNERPDSVTLKSHTLKKLLEDFSPVLTN